MDSLDRLRQQLDQPAEQLPEGFGWDEMQAGIYDKMPPPPPPPPRRPRWWPKLFLFLGILAGAGVLTYALYNQTQLEAPAHSLAQTNTTTPEAHAQAQALEAAAAEATTSTAAQPSASPGQVLASAQLSPKPTAGSTSSSQGQTAQPSLPVQAEVSATLPSTQPAPLGTTSTAKRSESTPLSKGFDSSQNDASQVLAEASSGQNPALATRPAPLLRESVRSTRENRQAQQAGLSVTEGPIQGSKQAQQATEPTATNEAGESDSAPQRILPVLAEAEWTALPHRAFALLAVPVHELNGLAIATPPLQQEAPVLRPALSIAASANAMQHIGGSASPTVSAWWGYGGHITYTLPINKHLELSGSYGLRVLREEFAFSDRDVVLGSELVQVQFNQVNTNDLLLRQGSRTVPERFQRTRNELSYNRYLVHEIAIGAHYSFDATRTRGLALGLQVGAGYLQQATGRQLNADGEVQDLSAKSSFGNRVAGFVAPTVQYRLPLSSRLSLTSSVQYQHYLTSSTSDALVFRPTTLSAALGLRFNF